jgi:cytochrome c-type biogenesis protein CcmH/NrfG
VVWAIAGGAVAAAVALVLVLGTTGDDGSTGTAAGPAPTSTTVDLDTVTNEQLEQVVNEHPEVVAMRLRLIERYVEDQDFDAAQRHAEEAVVRATTVDERSRALTWLGLTTAILGDPDDGEGLLVQSLGLDPTNRESLYYLARVRFEFLDDPEGAIAPLEELLSSFELTDDQRALFDDMLTQARVAAGVAATTTTSTP